MNYRVIFLDRATDQLAVIHLAAVQQGWDVPAINAAMARIDAGLQRDPLSRGESRSGRER